MDELTPVQLSPKAIDLNLYALNPHTFANYRAGYIDLWSRMVVTKGAEAAKQVALIVSHADVYKDIEREGGVPWVVIALLHLREAGPQDVGRWQCVLHNGERIIGTGRKTTLVPKGYGPFKTFKEAALDAIKHQSLDEIDWSSDGVAALAFASECFNGFGYRSHGIPSPYLWGGTSVQQRGKYVSDGKYDASVMDPQIGTMALLKVLMQQTGFSFDKHPSSTVAVPVAKPQSPPSAPAPAPSIATSVDPQKQVGGLLDAAYKFVQAILKRK